MKYAPIYIPTLNRYEHFYRLMESLKRNSWACYTDVIVAVDYPPSEKYRDGWQKICNYLDKSDFSIFNNFIVFKRDVNYGIPKNINELWYYVQSHYDRWIYSEDDLEYSPNYLEYMDKCLDKYENDPDVIAVTGYSYPIDWKVSEGATYMRQNFNVASWGLGMWKSRQAEFNSYILTGQMLKDAPSVIKSEKYKVMIDSTFQEYFRDTLKYDKNKSIECRVTDCSLTAFLACYNKYCISPVISKVRNWGFDGTGVCCPKSSGANTMVDDLDYAAQETDTATSFELVLNDDGFLDENRRLLNKFDLVPSEKMAIAELNFKLIKRYGMKLGYVIRMAIAVINRIKRKFN